MSQDFLRLSESLELDKEEMPFQRAASLQTNTHAYVIVLHTIARSAHAAVRLFFGPHDPRCFRNLEISETSWVRVRAQRTPTVPPHAVEQTAATAAISVNV